MPGIFISYRRDDAPGHAGRIFDRLRSRFGSDVVFMDVTGIDAGVDFVDVLHKKVGSCDALLAIIGPQWLTAAHENTRRLDDPHDFVRIEIAGALQRNVRVLPVLVEGASMPATESLPADLQALTRRQAVELRDARWDDDIERLIEGLERFLSAGTPSPDAHAPLPREQSVEAQSSTTRGIAIGAAAVLILALAGVLAWRAGMLSGSEVRSETSAPASGTTASTAAPAQPSNAASPPAAAAITPSRSANVEAPTAPPHEAPVPDVTGKPLLDAREMLRHAGLRFTVRLVDERSKPAGIVQSQALAEATPNQPRRVLLTATPIATVLVHYTKGDEQTAQDLVDYLKDQPSTIGTIVRSLAVGPRQQMAGHVAYSEPRLAEQANAVAKDASEFLMRFKRPPFDVAVRPFIARTVIVVALY